VVVVEGEIFGIPEEIDNIGAEVGSGVAVACGLGGGARLVEVSSEDLVRLV
jgi:hypothetical protein